MKHRELLDDFYSSESIAQWKAIIGDDLHYHFGCFDSEEMSLEQGLEKVVREFYEYIPFGSSILDAGCGWGGPAKMLIKERNCNLLGVTVSKSQYEYCSGLGLTVKLDDLEAMELDQSFDVIVMFESLEHIQNKLKLLRKLRDIGKTLILRTNCTAYTSTANRPEFARSMYLETPHKLRRFLERAGWEVILMDNRRNESMLTFKYWKQRLEMEYKNAPPPGHLGDILALSNYALSTWPQWSRGNPLINIVAQ